MENIDIKYIKTKIQNILNRSHDNIQKRTIKEYPDRFNFACCVCGDSEKSGHKKRGNLYLDNMNFKCFNCDTYMTFTKFCDTFNESIDMETRIKIYNYIDENTIYKKTDDYILDELEKLIDLSEFVNYFNTKKNSWLCDIKPVQKNSHVYQYLKYERLIDDFSRIYQGVYRVIKNGKTVYSTNVMINLNMSLGDVNKLLGIQIRNLEKDKSKRFYKIVEFEELYNFMNPTEPLDDMEAISYNKLSHFYNILNIDFESPITIFEGFLDSLLFNVNGLTNNIGLVGAKNDKDLLKFLTESDADLELRFFYDYDTTGNIKSEGMIKNGYPVFLWNMLFDKLLEKNKKNKHKLKDIIDLNDLVIISKNKNISDKLKLDKFFSKDSFDVIYINKNKKIKKPYKNQLKNNILNF